MNNLLNNDIIIYSLCTVTLCLITGYYIKSYFNSTVIESPNSPPTFNLNHEQIKEIQGILDKGDELDKETRDKLDQDFKSILGPENHAEYQQEIQEIQDQLNQQIQDIFTNLF